MDRLSLHWESYALQTSHQWTGSETVQWIKYKGYKEKLSIKQEKEWMDKDMASKWLENYDKINKVKSKNRKEIIDPPMFEDGDTSGPPPWD